MRSRDGQDTRGGDRAPDAAALPVVIGVAQELADRVRLAELLDGFGPVGLVLVASIDDARLLLDGTANGHGAANGHGTANGHDTINGHGTANGYGTANGHGTRDNHGTGNNHATGNGHGAGHGGTIGRVKQLAGLRVDSDLLLARRNGHRVGLTPLEHDLLVCLGSEPRRTWTHAALHETVWNTRHTGGQSDIHSVVKRLRRKLVALDAQATIEAVRGVGFRLEDHADTATG